MARKPKVTGDAPLAPETPIQQPAIDAPERQDLPPLGQPPRPRVAPPAAPPPALPLDDPEDDSGEWGVDPAAENQKRFQKRAILTLLAVGASALGAVALLPENTETPTEKQPTQEIAPDVQPEMEEALAGWIKGPVKQGANTRNRLEKYKADISITVTCLPSGYEGGSAFFSWKNELSQPNIPDSNANPLIITGYGEIPHPNSLCLEHTGEASQYTRYFAAQ